MLIMDQVATAPCTDPVQAHFLTFRAKLIQRRAPRLVITQQRRRYENDHATDEKDNPVFSKRDPKHSVTQMNAVQPVGLNNDRPKDPG